MGVLLAKGVGGMLLVIGWLMELKVPTSLGEISYKKCMFQMVNYSKRAVAGRVTMTVITARSYSELNRSPGTATRRSGAAGR